MAASRNGPPLAVRITRATRLGQSWSKHWKIALCSESTGRSRTPCLAAARVPTRPAQTHDAFFALALVAPAFIAAMVGFRHGRPTTWGNLPQLEMDSGRGQNVA